MWYVRRRLAGFGRPDLALMRRTLGFGLKTHAGRIMLLGNFRLDQWLLGAISGPRALGLYSVAVSWAEALWYLPTALKFVQRPFLVRSARLDAGRQAAVGFRAATLGSAVIGLGMIVAAPWLCASAFGARFHGSIIQLRILVPGAVGVLALTVLGNALVAQRRPILSSVALGTGFLCTVALDVLLIPGHQGIGAAVASTIAYTAAGAMMCIFFTRALGCPIGELLPRLSDVSWVLARAREMSGVARVIKPRAQAARDR
jgi:O-antigen/teichoic acid export membrane protein